MGLPIRADIPGPVNGKSDRQFLDRDIVDDLVVTALKEGGINRGKRPVSFRRHSRGEGDSVLLRNPHIKSAVGMRLLKQVNACARRHCRGDRNDTIVFFGQFGQHLAKYILIRRCVWLRLMLCAGQNIEFRNAMVLIR